LGDSKKVTPTLLSSATRRSMWAMTRMQQATTLQHYLLNEKKNKIKIIKNINPKLVIMP
jgi:hypothetical protein